VAKNQAGGNPKNTIYDAKRLIGRKYTDTEVIDDMKEWPFKVIADPNEKPMICVAYKNEMKKFYAEEISAMLLKKLKEVAEEYLKRPVSQAVITVPAYFNNSQR
jgi:L1 cell adhesion molecule like protein